MTSGFVADDRAVLRVSGADHLKFLQDLVTNSTKGLGAGAVYTALLTPQGKYLADFFMVPEGDAVLIDADAGQVADLARRLMMYKLRAAVDIAPAGLEVVLGTGPSPEGAFADPRDTGLGWRLYQPEGQGLPDGVATWDPAAYEALRIAHCVPKSGVELLANETFILEAGFDRLNGVDFRKGCYVGQEVTARMRHKTELRKGIRPVLVEQPAPEPGTEIRRDGKVVGTLHSSLGGAGLAYLRFDRIGPGMEADGKAVQLAEAGAETA
ncbi:CAF17-like 4Fe-4S cluster assembly/insertion protein YgfZ [Oceanibium sediminis]|uniref:CAF17-like 4Fe-4S cluster assembly/insertion protein YgfZ n=1 Tax=Oceanibium sediminis TaxID=2026339 RepID=UPI000DD39F10|nr:folate-binding protein YgfZ [Oceanibium sediminis]